MAIIGRFVGVADYLEPSISELPGARRDATALWALFADSLSDSDCKLILDKDATASGIKYALQETLSAAAPDDAVVFYFAGHGTPDHRLVAHDTNVAAWAETTITVEELGSLFKSAKAKSVLCIFDCCFSGGISARVFENAPIPRTDSASLKTFAGEGRVLIAAADFNEYSYEIPTTGHGLFTKALLDVLQELTAASDIQVIVSRVMETVRAEGMKLGLKQTPVMYGEIKGGLQLPVFSRGNNFKAYFPELAGIRIGREVSELAGFYLPQPVLDAWAPRLKSGLNELQLEAINTYRILDGASLMVVAPTSSGKTFIGEIAAVRAVTDGRKVVFLLPYKALVNEKFEYFNELYAQNLHMRVIRCTGDYSDQAPAYMKGKYDIALLTYEMFLGLSINNAFTLNNIGLVVLDEAQFITDPNRGITVELLLTKLNSSKASGIKPQLITLSATVGAINHFDDWLGLKVLKTDARPVPLTEGVLDRSGTFQYRSQEGEILTTQFLESHLIRQRTSQRSSQDVIVPLVRQLLTANTREKIIIFRNRRGSASGCAAYLARELGLPPATEELAQLPAFDLSRTSGSLRDCLNGGTAFHTTDLDREERSLVEKAFRASHDNVRVLAATTTVAAGINTPASTVILVEHAFPGQLPQPYTVAEYKNMVGRAGRLGFQEEGQSIMLADSAMERQHLFSKYVLGSPEEISSSFSEGELTTWLIRLLAQVNQLSKPDAITLLTNTFGGYLKNRKNPGWQELFKNKLEEALNLLIRHELLEEQNGFIRLTHLGLVCGQSTLCFNSVIRLIDLLRLQGNAVTTIEELLVLAQALEEADQRYTPMARNEFRWPQQAQAKTSANLRLLNHYTADTLMYSRRSKRVSIILDWLAGNPIDTIQRDHSANAFNTVNPGDVRSIADMTRFNLRAVYQIAAILSIGSFPPETDLEAMLRRLETGIPAACLGLLNLPFTLERGDMLRLFQHQIGTPEDYWAKPPAELEMIIGPKVRALDDFRPATAD